MEQELEALRRWRATVRARDDLVRAAIAAGANDNQISKASGISRTVIGTIRNPDGPLAVAEAARRALRGWSCRGEPPQVRVVSGQVLLSLPAVLYNPPARLADADGSFDDWNPELREAEREWRTAYEMERTNWASALLRRLRDNGLHATSDDCLPTQLAEHLARLDEPYAVITREGK